MAVSTTDRLATAFVERTLPKAEWTHEAHLRVGLWHLLRHSPAEAMDLLRERIRLYNEAVGGVNSDSAGYHETITGFYVLIIAEFLEGRDRSTPVDELAEVLLSEFGDKNLPLRHYSRARLFSVEARRSWTTPDLLPIASADEVFKASRVP